MCPAGYGKVADADLPDLWQGRRLLQLPGPDSNTSAAVFEADFGLVMYNNSTQQDLQQQQVTTLGLPMPPPSWATDCLPCPINFFSPGGAVGFAECQVCPPGWTTGNASASADCIGK